MRGNRSWRVETASGPVLLKLYQARRGRISRWVSRTLSAWVGRKSPPDARARRRTERSLLQLWHDHGIAVPRLVDGRGVGLGDARSLVIEFIEGPTVAERLLELRGCRAQRDALLRRLGADVARRHRIALALRDARLLHEHPSVQHVFAAGSGFVWFDLERAYRPDADAVACAAREVLGLLRSCHKLAPAKVFQADVRAFVEGYHDTDLLRRLVDVYSHGLLWRLDRALRARRGGRGRGKYEALDALRSVLDVRAAG